MPDLTLSEQMFFDNLKSFGLGNLSSELADEQKKIVEAVMRTGKKGKLVLEIGYQRKGHNGMIVGAVVKPIIPRDALDKVSMFVPIGKSELYEEDPNQLNIDNVHKFGDKKVNQV